MLKNLFKTAYRSLNRNRFYAILNTIGLVVGMAVILIVYLIYSYETSFDTFHSDKERIFRVNTLLDFNGTKMDNRGAPRPLYEILENEVPEIESVAIYTTFTLDGWKVNQNSSEFVLDNAISLGINEGFFDVFLHNWEKGDAETLFRSPNGVAISSSLEQALFNGEGIGREMSAEFFDFSTNETAQLNFQVVAVLEDDKSNTDFKGNIFVPFVPHQAYMGLDDNWGSITSNFQLFVKFDKNSDVANTVVKVEDLIAQKFETSENSFIKAWRSELMPLANIHFDTKFGHENPRKATKENLKILLIVGIIVLLSACINFINLSTAFSFARSKEIGIRKVIGSSRRWLILQFLIETFLLVLGAGLLSLILTDFLIQKINPIYDLGLQESLLRYFLRDVMFYLFFIGFVLALTLISGFYPAMVISGFNPIKAFKNNPSNRGSGLILRRSLVIIQFSLSMVLIFGTLLVNRQVEFLKTKDLGFDHYHTGYFYLPSSKDLDEKAKLLKERVKQLPFVEEASTGGETIINNGWSSRTAEFERDGEKVEAFFNVKSVDPEYFKTYGMTFVSGNAYEQEQSKVMVINESMAREIGSVSPFEAVGKEFFINESAWVVTGVVSDFHFQPLKNEIQPIMFLKQDSGPLFTYRFNQGDFKENVTTIVEMAKELFDIQEVKTYTVSEVVGTFYQEEEKLTKVLGLFTVLAYFICALGLIGLVSYMAFQKRKEISIRRVFGAGITQVTADLLKEFVLLVGIAAALSIPLAWFLGKEWLAHFPYRTNLGMNIILLVIGISLLFACLTVFFQSFQAARKNPVDNLRSE
jgi:putative ABC transport system permease protein